MRVGLDATEADMLTRPGSGCNEDDGWLQDGDCTCSNVVGLWRKGNACKWPVKVYGAVDKAAPGHQGWRKVGFRYTRLLRATAEGSGKEQDSVGL